MARSFLSKKPVRRIRQPVKHATLKPPSKAMETRDFPVSWWRHFRKAVCRRCHLVMVDSEPSTRYGEFWHHAPKEKRKAFRCPNNGKPFYIDEHEIEPFMRKARRRALKRAGIRA